MDDAAIRNRWIRFFDMDSDVRTLYQVHYKPGLGPRPWPYAENEDQRVTWALEYYESMLRAREVVADDRIPFLAPYTGTEIFAEAFGCQAPKIPFHCTLKGARRALPLQSRGLDCVCGYFGIGLDHHHALSDARACAEIFLRLQELGLRPEDMRLNPPGKPRPRARLLTGPDAPKN